MIYIKFTEGILCNEVTFLATIKVLTSSSRILLLLFDGDMRSRSRSSLLILAADIIRCWLCGTLRIALVGIAYKAFEDDTGGGTNPPCKLLFCASNQPLAREVVGVITDVGIACCVVLCATLVVYPLDMESINSSELVYLCGERQTEGYIDPTITVKYSVVTVCCRNVHFLHIIKRDYS